MSHRLLEKNVNDRHVQKTVADGASQGERASLKALRKETEFRSRLIGGLQVAGATVILVTRLLYGPPWTDSWPFWIVGAIALALGFAYLLVALNDIWTKPPLSWLLGRMNHNLVEQNDAVIQIGFAMMIVDCFLVGVLLILSGGFFHSSYSPLLFAVFTISITLRLPRKKIAAVFLTALGVAIATILIWEFVPEFRVDLIADREQGHRGALALTFSATLILTIVGGFEALRNPVPERQISAAFHRLKGTIKEDAHMRPALRNGMRAIMDDVGRRSSGLMLGRVHDFRTIIEQAIILMYPHQHHERGSGTSQKRRASKDPCAEIAYLTFAAHWLDDLFDDRIWTGVEHLSYKCDLPELIRGSRHLRRIRRSMLRRTRSTQHIVDRAIHRLWLAASMQHRENEKDFPDLLDRYVKVVMDDSMSEELTEAYARMKANPDHHIIIWGTAKNILDLFDSCGPEFDSTCSEIYSIFYTPFLIYQNAAQERDIEEWSEVFRANVIRHDDLFSQDVADRLHMCITVFEESIETLRKQSEVVLDGRRRQLWALMGLYGHTLPRSLQAEYERLVDESKLWVPS